MSIQANSVSASMKFRPDIQGLRAIAVLSVLIFHVWPDLLTGGYVGVDVFFVISGYLITKMLLVRAENSTTNILVDFYARRLSRLLPASLLVLLLVILAMPLLPSAMQEETLQGVLSAALYVNNWWQALLAVDYLGAENAASPVQHFWSLSVEEQYYALIGITFGCTILLAARWGKSLNRILFVFFLLVMFVSLACSVILTPKSPEFSYFASHTRFWELALGALIASFPAHWIPAPGRERQLRLAGVVMILAACIFLTAETVFPGWIALLPTLGAGSIIWAGSRGNLDDLAGKVLASKPFTFVGDISYSLYLWHWPLVVFYANIAGEDPGVMAGGGIIALAFAGAAASKRFVEDPFRVHGKLTLKRAWIIIGGNLLATAIVCGLAIAWLFGIAGTNDDNSTNNDANPGPAVINQPFETDFVKLRPKPAIIKKDLPVLYANSEFGDGKICHLAVKPTELVPCRVGKGEFEIALVGDSHAANWFPALREIVEKDGKRLRLTSYTKSACGMMLDSITVKGREYKECAQWSKNLLDQFAKEPPDLIIYAKSSGSKLFGKNKEQTMTDAILKTWDSIHQLNIPIVALADTPSHREDPANCVEKANCGTALKSAVRPDPVTEAAERDTKVTLINMNDLICEKDFCPAVVGNVVVWRDKHHLTATYSRMLAPYLEKRLEKLIQP